MPPTENGADTTIFVLPSGRNIDVMMLSTPALTLTEEVSYHVLASAVHIHSGNALSVVNDVRT